MLNKSFHIINKIYNLKNFITQKNLQVDLNLPELPFTIIITSFNNEQYCNRNVYSALNQNYTNYDIIYIDDCSTDQTNKYLKNFSQNSKINFIHNKTRKKKLANLYNIIHTLPDNRIIIELDGDDYLKHKNVIKIFNAYFQTNKSWLVYANYLNKPQEIAQSMNLKNFTGDIPYFIKKFNYFRQYPWIFSGLRSYYAGLFKKIKKEDLISKTTNNFYEVCHDMAMLYPMLEMAKNKVSYIPNPLLIRNINSPINDFKIYDNLYREKIIKEIRNAPKYSEIEKLF